MVYRHSEEEIQKYFLSEALNQSSLKVILSQGMEAYLDKREELKNQEELYYEERSYFVIGSGVDMWISHGEEYFKTRHHITLLTKKPSEVLMSITNQLFDEVYKSYLLASSELPEEERPVFAPSLDDIDLRNRINEIATSYGYQPTYGVEARINAVTRGCMAYWEELCKGVNKQILSSEEYAIIEGVVKSFQENETLRSLVFNHFQEGTSADVVLQLPLYFFMNVDCKALLDIVVVDHKRKAIIPMDIKTHGGYLASFNWSIKKHRYDIQAAFYTKALESVGKKHLANLLNRPEVEEYLIIPFSFIVQSTKKLSIPMVFVIEEETIEAATIGKTLPDGELYPGIVQALEKYKAWYETGFNMAETLENNKGLLNFPNVVHVNKNFAYKDFNLL